LIVEIPRHESTRSADTNRLNTQACRAAVALCEATTAAKRVTLSPVKPPPLQIESPLPPAEPPIPVDLPPLTELAQLVELPLYIERPLEEGFPAKSKGQRFLESDMFSSGQQSLLPESHAFIPFEPKLISLNKSESVSHENVFPGLKK